MRPFRYLCAGTFLVVASASATAAAAPGSLAGFAYSGDYQSIAERFPYSGGINAAIRQEVATHPPADLEIETGSLAQLQGRLPLTGNYHLLGKLVYRLLESAR